jgi:membrane dipeptidase
MRLLIFSCFFVCFFAGSLRAQSYKRFHKKAVLADTHNDVLSTVTLKGMNMEGDLTGKAHSDLARFKKGGVDIQVFSVFCDERYGYGTAFAFANREIDSLQAIIARNPGRMMAVNNPQQLKTAVKQKKLGCLIGVEGGHMIEDRPDYLDSLYKRGTRYMTITWNNSTPWATSAKDETENKIPGLKKGLSEHGKKIIQRMNELGMMVDLSHVGEQTFWDVMAVTRKPVLVSHSSVYALCGHRRNLKDDQIRAIGKNGGVIHVNFYSGFIDSTYDERKKQFHNRHRREKDSLQALKWAEYEIDEWLSDKYREEANTLRPPLGLLIDHIDHIVQLIGVNHVGLGSDFDGIESAPQQLDGVQDFPNITRALLERGYTRRDVRKILGGNFIRLFQQNCN